VGQQPQPAVGVVRARQHVSVATIVGLGTCQGVLPRQPTRAQIDRVSDDDLVTRLFRLWDDIPSGQDAEAAFRELYADPVVINGRPVTISELVARARTTADALVDRSTQVLYQVADGDATAVAFRIRAKHVGPLPTPLGEIPGTGGPIDLQVIDVLSLRDGVIHELWMVADYLGALGASGAISVR
jgi:hypothetical protein